MVLEAVLAVVTHGVVGAVALAVDHAPDVLVLLLLGQTPLGVTVARARATDCHVIDGVVVFFLPIKKSANKEVFFY